jgi:16S rRNA (uracil1498-N3)-methyltransferase
VSEIFPLVTERTEKRRLSKFERLNLIAMEAAEQCGRMKIPVIRHPANYDEIIGKLSNGFIAYEYEGTRHLSDYEKDLQSAKEIQVIIGPEGGLSEAELELAKASKVKPFTFGPRILRTETAAIAALSLILLD